ncbi:MAG: hypothetical protein IJ689_06635 [Alphaproteobacteria bacterium]|nr:hypothetical protein [Alphaproteobacteria bacterium]
MGTNDRERDMLQAIDRETYILKNRIMLEFDKHFGTNLRAHDADDLHYDDILGSVENQNGDEVYAVLKKVVKHGVTTKQKEFLYRYIGTGFFRDEASHDFDDYLAALQAEIPSAYAATLKFIKNRIEVLHHYRSEPFWWVVVVREIPETKLPIEAILVQNGFVMIVRTVKSWSDLPEAWTESDVDSFYGDHDDDDY